MPMALSRRGCCRARTAGQKRHRATYPFGAENGYHTDHLGTICSVREAVVRGRDHRGAAAAEGIRCHPIHHVRDCHPRIEVTTTSAPPNPPLKHVRALGPMHSSFELSPYPMPNRRTRPSRRSWP
jgi:hypothetical protein